MNDSQMGFGRETGTVGATYELKNVINRYISRECGQVLAFFADIRAAFDKAEAKKIF